MDIGQDNSGETTSCSESSIQKLWDVLRQYEEHVEISHQLVQLWTLSGNSSDSYVLECIRAPYISGQDDKFKLFRECSSKIKFPIATAPNTSSMVARVFTSGCAEICPDIGLYDECEYRRLSLARQCSIKATVGIGFYSPSCKGVLEVVTSKHLDSSNFSVHHHLLLEVLNQRGFHTGLCNPTLFKMVSEERSLQVTRILVKKMQESCDLLVCQTWAVFLTSRARSHRSSDKSCMRLRCKDLPYAISGMYLEAFHEFCSTVTLKGDQAGLTGEVVAGEKNIAYCRDVCKLTAVNYALVPVARWFDLHCCCTFGMNLPGYDSSDGPTDPGKSSYIVFECFLPKCCSMTDANVVANFRTEQVQLLISTIRSTADALGVHVSIPAGGVEHLVPQAHLMAETKVGILDKLPATSHAESRAAKTSTGLVKRKPGTGGERSVSFAVLQQHLQYDLQTAAKKIGVCPTTLKKICRQNGIARWPRRSVNKDKSVLLLAEREHLERQEREGNLKEQEQQQHVESTVREQQPQERGQTRTESNDNGADTAKAVLADQAPLSSQSLMVQKLSAKRAEEEGPSVSSCSHGDAYDAAMYVGTAQEVQEQLPGADSTATAEISHASDPANDATSLEAARSFSPIYLQEAATAAARAANLMLARDTLSPMWQTDEGLSRMLALSSSTLTCRDPVVETWAQRGTCSRDPLPLCLLPSPKPHKEGLMISTDLDVQVGLLRKRSRTTMEMADVPALPKPEGYFYGAEQQLPPLNDQGVLMPRAAASHQGSDALARSQEMLGQSKQNGTSSEATTKNDFIIVEAQMGNMFVHCKQPLEGEGSGYQALVQRIAERFQQPSADIRLQYVDEEGDLIMLMCDDDWISYVETINQSQSGVFTLLVSMAST